MSEQKILDWMKEQHAAAVRRLDLPDGAYVSVIASKAGFVVSVYGHVNGNWVSAMGHDKTDMSAAISNCKSRYEEQLREENEKAEFEEWKKQRAIQTAGRT